jgi:hypothetical protein
VQPTAADTIHAPARSTSTTPANTIEHYVGRLVAGAAATLLEALAERSDGGLTRATRTRGGDRLAELYGLRCFMIGTWDFDAIAREYGRLALRAADISPSTADTLVDEVLVLYQIPLIRTRGPIGAVRWT